MSQKDKHRLSIYGVDDRNRRSSILSVSDAGSDIEIRKKIQHGTRLSGVYIEILFLKKRMKINIINFYSRMEHVC